jgi:phage anti-repressor protein
MASAKAELERRNQMNTKRQQAYRERMKAKGFCLVQDWVPCEKKEEFHRVARMLRDGKKINFGGYIA